MDIFNGLKKLIKAQLLVLAGISLVFSACTVTNSAKPDYAKARKLLLRDEGLSKLSFIDLANPAKDWFVSVPVGRDIQLVGNGRVLIGTSDGYEERDIATGNKVFELTKFKGTQTARRLKNGNTLLAGTNWQQKQGIVLVEVNSNGDIQQTRVFPGFTYVRCIRETVKGTLLVTADDLVFESNANNEIIWRAKVAGPPVKPHVWQAVRLGNGQTIASTGYAKNFQVYDAQGNQVQTITGPDEVNPNFFAGFQVLKNGNFVVTNWQGHGPGFGNSGSQILEYDPSGKLVWSWKQDAARFSSLQGIIVLDGLNVNKLHVEDANGALTPVN